MTTVQLNVYEAKAQLSRLIESALNGDDVVIARAGKPAVRLVKWEPPAPRVPGRLRGQIRIAEDFDEFTEQDDRDWHGD